MDQAARTDFAPVILVVDDDPQVRSFFSRVLAGARYEVHEVCNGVEAKAAVQNMHFDLIILDLNMPEMDGFEVLGFARAELPDLKIVVASGFMDGTMLKAAERLGAVATLNKPVEVELLLSTVRSVVEGSGRGEKRKGRSGQW